MNKHLFAKFFILIFIQIVFSQDDIEEDDRICYLTGALPNKPSPSLTKCYKYNKRACCLSVHDDDIKDKLSALLPGACARKYGALEDLYCMGCNLKEPFYHNATTKTIRVCTSFLEKLWNSTDYNKPSNYYDNCGFKNVFTGLTDKTYIIPSLVFLLKLDFS